MNRDNLRKVKYMSSTYPEIEYREAWFHAFANEYCSHLGVQFAKSIAILENKEGDVFRIDGDRIVKFLS